MSASEPNQDEWQVESLRLTVFLADMIDPAVSPFWESLVGRPPDEIRNIPRQQMVTEEGPYLGWRLRAEVRQNRIDWRLSFDPRSPALRLPTLGPYHSVEPQFRVLMQKWLAGSPDVHRLGYGSILLLPLGDISEVCAKLIALLKTVQLDQDGAQDFMYRINRRRNSQVGIEGLKINRLSTWSAAQIMSALVEIPSGGEGVPRVVPSQGPGNMCRLELDMNTSPDFRRKFTTSEIENVFDELAALSNEIVEQGDIP